jgi:hypothetical protein
MKVLLLGLFLVNFSAFANKKNGENFEQAKARTLDFIAKREVNLQAHKACVSAATDGSALKACRDKNKEAMESLKSERETAKAEWKAKRKK